MCARLLVCPLCSQPGFLTLDALSAGLISVATRPLICPVCNEVLLGIDKLTIHLFSHTINLNGSAIESSKHINDLTSNSNQLTVQNLQDTTIQDWHVSKVQTVEMGKIPQSNNSNLQSNIESFEHPQISRNKVPNLNSAAHTQDQIVSLKNAPQTSFLTDHSCNNEVRNICLESHDSTKIMSESCKNSQDAIPEMVKMNYRAQFYASDNSKQINILQNHTGVEEENIETFKHWVQNQQCDRRIGAKNERSLDIRKLNGTPTETAESCNNGQNTTDNDTLIITNKESKFSNFELFPSVATACASMPLNKFNNEDTTRESSPAVDPKNQEALKHEQILPHLKVLKALATKEKSERCNICGFHFPDYNILLLHKQLVHMIDEKDSNVIPEGFLKNYSCHLCSKVFKMRGSLMVHMRVAHMGYSLGSLPKDGQVELIFNENGYNCPTCGKKFKKEQHVIQHLKTHEAKQWECDVCSKMFTTKYFLKKHKRLHSGEMPYKCNICNKTFTFQQSYHKHRLYHKDDKPHMCTTCGRSFKELSTLHNHERIHTGEKPFACETCGKCFRQRVSYLVHRRIHTGVMPYKCIMCGKSFRYKVSQRTHKCPIQQVGTVQQSNTMEQNLIQLPDTQSTSNESCTIQKNSSQDNQPMLRVVNNEENKYVLIINTQGQHLLTRQLDIGSAQASVLSKEQKLEEYVGTNTDNKELKDAWSSNIPDSPVFEKSTEAPAKAHLENEKPNQEDANDFFSMVMSPLQNGLSSPTTEMEHLRVSSPKQKEDTLEPYGNIKNNSNSIQIDIVNANMEQSFNPHNNVANALQTINEESLKQLLYGINDK